MFDYGVDAVTPTIDRRIGSTLTARVVPHFLLN